MSYTHPLRIRFVDDETAYRLFQHFPPEDLPYVEGWSRKRDGASQLILLTVSEKSDLDAFRSLCRAHPQVLEVSPLTESEFWAAPSNAT